MSELVTRAQLRAAEQVVRRFFPLTPVLAAPRLAVQVGAAEVAMKLESCTPIRTFKLRGALVKLQVLADAGVIGGVCTASAGNHGLAVARAARLFGRPATICVPETANPQKAALIAAEGARLVRHGEDYQAAFERCLEIAAAEGLALVHAYDDADIIAGQGSVGLELLDANLEFDLLYAGIGGGGLLSGVAAAIKQARPHVRVIGVQPAGADSMARSLEAGRVVELERVATVADGLGARKPGPQTLAHTQAFVDEVVRVSDEEILNACRLLLREERLVAEPAGAACVAALVKQGPAAVRGRRVAVLISGANISDDVLAQLLHA